MRESKVLGEVFDAHTDAECKTRDIETTMATMGASPHVTHVPTMTGGHGRDEVRRFYETWFIGHWPEDTVVAPVSRTVGETQVVDFQHADPERRGLPMEGLGVLVLVVALLDRFDLQIEVPAVSAAGCAACRVEAPKGALAIAVKHCAARKPHPRRR